MWMYISLWPSSPVAFIKWAIVFKRTCQNVKGGSTRARSARERSPIPKKMWQYTHPRNFGNHVTVRPTEWPSICPHHRETNVKSHTFQLVWEPANWYCASIPWSIHSCQNRVSADQYHMTVSRAQVSTNRVCVFLKLSADKLLVVKYGRLKFIVWFNL